MNLACRIACVPAAILLALILFWHAGSEPAPEADIHLGTWTCESGPTGNSVYFGCVETELSTPLVRAFRGRVKVDDLLGVEVEVGEWNFGYWEPLIINLHFGDAHGYAAIKKVDQDHLLFRYTTDCNLLLHDPFDHPDVFQLRRMTK